MPDTSTEDGALISEAAALYGIRPSTLRWWEKQAVVNQPRRVGPHRRYTNRNLRQIGMAYLCRVVGRMPLERAAVVTSLGTSGATWRSAVTEQIAQLDRDIADLGAARDYLAHLLRCEAEVISDCDHLDGAPPGRSMDDGPDLVLAARDALDRQAGRGVGRRAEPRVRDLAAQGHGPADGVGSSKASTRCLLCGERVTPAPGRGRPRKYCSPACRQRAYRRRRA